MHAALSARFVKCRDYSPAMFRREDLAKLPLHYPAAVAEDFPIEPRQKQQPPVAASARNRHGDHGLPPVSESDKVEVLTATNRGAQNCRPG